MTKMHFINAYLKLATDAQVREFARATAPTDTYRDVECVTLRASEILGGCVFYGADHAAGRFFGWAS
jgi:hypothetical protein